MLVGHGNDIYDYQGKIIADFSSNIPYRNASEQIMEHLSDKLQLIGNYPDPNARVLRNRIALHHDLSPENILVTNGSAEAFYLLAHLFAGKKSTITFPAFAEYEDACELYRHDLSFLDIKELQNQKCFFTDTVWFALPNNPDGTITPFETIENLCWNNPHTFFIVDNAYGELCSQCRSIVPLHARYRNFISVHSLTKTFAIPGLRLGYIIAKEDVINQLQHLRTPWTVNALALEAGNFVMSNYNRLLPDRKALCEASMRFQQQLSTLSNIEVIPSLCNFFLARLKEGTAAELKNYLIEKHGILIRNADNFRGLSSQHFRLSVQEKETNDNLKAVLHDFSKRVTQ